MKKRITSVEMLDGVGKRHIIMQDVPVVMVMLVVTEVVTVCPLLCMQFNCEQYNKKSYVSTYL